MYEQGSVGLVPFVFSVPFVSPSLSQSAAAHIAFVVTGIPEPPTHGLFGAESVPFGLPSPSQSAAAQIALVVTGVPEPPTHGFNGCGSVPFEVPSPSQSNTDQVAYDELEAVGAVVYEHGSDGLVPFVFSIPFVSPSLSQSAAAQIALVVTGVPEPPTHGFNGCGSVPFGVPSPSQSNTDQVAYDELEAVGAVVYEHGLVELVPFVFSVPFVSPSLSQSAAAQIALVVTGVPEPPTHGFNGCGSVPFGVPSPSQSNTDQVAYDELETVGAVVYEHGLVGLVPFVFSVPFVSPSLSQSAAAQIALVVTGVPEPPTHGFNGCESVPFGVPSPSQSNTDQVA